MKPATCPFSSATKVRGRPWYDNWCAKSLLAPHVAHVDAVEQRMRELQAGGQVRGPIGAYRAGVAWLGTVRLKESHHAGASRSRSARSHFDTALWSKTRAQKPTRPRLTVLAGKLCQKRGPRLAAAPTSLSVL